MGKDSSILQLLFAIIIIMIFNMKIVSRIDAIFFVPFFFFYILFFASPKLLGIFLLFFLQICGGFTPSTWVSTTALS